MSNVTESTIQIANDSGWLITFLTESFYNICLIVRHPFILREEGSQRSSRINLILNGLMVLARHTTFKTHVIGHMEDNDLSAIATGLCKIQITISLRLVEVHPIDNNALSS